MEAAGAGAGAPEEPATLGWSRLCRRLSGWRGGHWTPVSTLTLHNTLRGSPAPSLQVDCICWGPGLSTGYGELVDVGLDLASTAWREAAACPGIREQRPRQTPGRDFTTGSPPSSCFCA